MVCGFDPATGKFGPRETLLWVHCSEVRTGTQPASPGAFPINVAPPKDKATLARDWCIAAFFAIMLLDHLIK